MMMNLWAMMMAFVEGVGMESMVLLFLILLFASRTVNINVTINR